MAIFECTVCGKSFDRIYNNRYCSDECKEKGKERIREARKRKAPTKMKTSTWLERYERSDRLVRLSMVQKATGVHYGKLSILYGEDGKNAEYKKLLKMAEKANK